MDPFVPSTDPQSAVTVTRAEIIYHRRVRVLDHATLTERSRQSSDRDRHRYRPPYTASDRSDAHHDECAAVLEDLERPPPGSGNACDDLGWIGSTGACWQTAGGRSRGNVAQPRSPQVRGFRRRPAPWFGAESGRLSHCPSRRLSC